MRRCDGKMDDRLPLLEEPFAQTLSGICAMNMNECSLPGLFSGGRLCTRHNIFSVVGVSEAWTTHGFAANSVRLLQVETTTISTESFRICLAAALTASTLVPYRLGQPSVKHISFMSAEQEDHDTIRG